MVMISSTDGPCLEAKENQMAKYEGAGGYGTISTLNQDQRQGRFYPHKSIFVFKQHPVSDIKCLDCLEHWREGEEYPAKCVKSEKSGDSLAADILASAASEKRKKS